MSHNQASKNMITCDKWSKILIHVERQGRKHGQVKVDQKYILTLKILKEKIMNISKTH